MGLLSFLPGGSFIEGGLNVARKLYAGQNAKKKKPRKRRKRLVAAFDNINSAAQDAGIDPYGMLMNRIAPKRKPAAKKRPAAKPRAVPAPPPRSSGGSPGPGRPGRRRPTLMPRASGGGGGGGGSDDDDDDSGSGGGGGAGVAIPPAPKQTVAPPSKKTQALKIGGIALGAAVAGFITYKIARAIKHRHH